MLCATHSFVSPPPGGTQKCLSSISLEEGHLLRLLHTTCFFSYGGFSLQGKPPLEKELWEEAVSNSFIT